MTDHYRKLATAFDEVGIYSHGKLIPGEIHVMVEKNKERVVFRFNKEKPQEFIDWHYENNNEVGEENTSETSE